MKTDFFYSKSTGLYVSRKPVVIDARIKNAAEVTAVRIDWDDEGRINYIDFDDAKNLMSALESKMMNPVEYWMIMNDARGAGDLNMVKELMSNRYAEWLDRVYFVDRTYIDDPVVVGKYKYNGEIKKSNCPVGTPGWFNPEGNIDEKTGEPIHVELNREKFATSWKYWSPDLGTSATKLGTTAPIRGYVTSVGKPSYDLGIPVDSRQPKQMIRECRYKPLEPVIDANILEQAERIIDERDGKGLVSFLKQHGHLFADSYDSQIYKLRETFFDMLGSIALREDVRDVSRKLYSIKNEQLKCNDFYDFVRNSRQRLKSALQNNNDIVFVMGHKNPDTDTVVSTLFEAWRNHLMNLEDVEYVPIVQGTRMPDEVVRLLGDMSDHILFTNGDIYKEARQSGLARWISVDQNREPEVQKYFIKIVDHHVVCETAKNRDLPKTLEMVGSCSALITRKYLGMGLELPQKLARILYGATLMDTENRVKHKMTEQDVVIMNYLKKKSHIESDSTLYRDLMSYLLNTYDADLLFRRDYKEDWGFGFAVAKVKSGLSQIGETLKKDVVSRMYELAVQNNAQKNLPFTLLKVTDYKDDNETVNRERIYPVFNKNASEKFRRTIRDLIESVIRFEFPDNIVELGDDFIDFYGTGMQLSRKKTAPVLEPVVAAFNKYFYSPSINRYVKRNFLRKTKEVRDIAEKISTDPEGRVNYITFPESKELAGKLGFEMLSMSEYWKVLQDAKAINDVQMVESLQGSNFVEFWDTAIVNKSQLIDHPKADKDKVTGEVKEVVVPKGYPGLIHPKDVDVNTGLPKIVRSPNEYGNIELWRYWEPDSDLVVPCRSYIFLLDQPCWDGKFHLGDSFPNLGIRPVVREVKEPDVKVKWDESHLIVELFMEREVHQFKWPKHIKDFLDIY